MSEEPPSPTEEACQRACLPDLLSKLGKNTFPSSKLLFDIVCYLGLRLMIRFILTPERRAAIAANLGTRRPRHFTEPLGLIDLVRSSSAPPTLAPLPLLSPSVAPPPTSALAPSVAPRRHSELQGQDLVEIFSVHVDFPFRGTIHLVDGRGSHSIYIRPNFDPNPDFYSRKKEWLTRHSDSSEFKNKLVLTGPHNGMSAFHGFTFVVAISGMDGCYKVSSEDWDSPIILDEINTTTVTTCMGSLYFTYGLVSDAVRAKVHFMMRLPGEASKVHGHIMAYIGKFEIGSTLFSKDIKDAVFIDPHVDSGVEFRLPLDRTCFAVPIGSSLHLKGELVFNGSEKVSINHSIPIPVEGLNFQSAWVQDSYCQTAVDVWFREIWI
ncbi:unnamed protein product [Alopecurus aequalis]